jgi:hypothetical protein
MTDDSREFSVGALARAVILQQMKDEISWTILAGKSWLAVKPEWVS